MRYLFLVLIFVNSYAFSQIGMGQWRLHMPSAKAIDIAEGDDKVFIAFEKGVAEYDLGSDEISVWDAVNGLSDINVSSIHFSDSENALFIGYDNGNIDKLQNNAVTNIPAIELAQIQGSKKIYSIKERNGFLYFATGFSIVQVDPDKEEVKNTWYPTNGNDPIFDIAFKGDSVYALTETGMLRGNVNAILADVAQWDLDARVPNPGSSDYKQIVNFNDELFILKVSNAYGADTLFQLLNNQMTYFSNVGFDIEINGIDDLGAHLGMSTDGAIYLYDETFSQSDIYTGFNLGGWVSPNAIVFEGSRLWMADNLRGVLRANSLFSSTDIQVAGPPKNSFYRLDWQRGKLAVAGGNLSQVFVTFNTSGVYFFENEEWELKDASNMPLWQGADISDCIAISINPANKDEVAVGSYSKVPLSIIDESGFVIDTLTEYNSLLEPTSLNNGWTMISDLEYDNQGNLWMLNGYANAPLKVMTNEGQWYEFEMNTSSKNVFTNDLVIDYSGNKWMSIKGVGMFGYNDNGTIDNPGDDQWVQLNTGVNTGALPSNEVNALAVDFDNEIWIGTDNGFAVLYATETAFDAVPGEYNAQRIKLEFEGNVEYLLGATNITDIEVDGGNRKWFGTANSGVILLSADGQEIIQQFTMENSPLISNSILDLEIDHNTGELYIVTDQGLISYRSDATYEDPDYSSVTVFPNPARPEFDGPITIQGIQYDSDVKITDVAGNLIYKTTSNGGTATWNGKTLDGMDVTTGVYLIWTAPNNGRKRFVGKVLVVN
ncbi:MAG: two-component regulator propeller domain-containing protein [Crocinitomicaceae bacterium]